MIDDLERNLMPLEDDDSSFMPMMSIDEDDEALKSEFFPEILPILPLKKYGFVPGRRDTDYGWAGKIHQSRSAGLRHEQIVGRDVATRQQFR